MEKIVRIGQVPREPQHRGGGVGGHALGHGPGGEGLYIIYWNYKIFFHSPSRCPAQVSHHLAETVAWADQLLRDGGGELAAVVHPGHVEPHGDVPEPRLGLGPGPGLHQLAVDGPELVELIRGEAEPELIVVLLLHLGHDLAAVLELVGLLEAGHEDGLHLVPRAARQQQVGGEVGEVRRHLPGQLASSCATQEVVQQSDGMMPSK